MRDSDYQVQDPLLTPREAAAERRQAISTFYRDWRKLKLVPEPIYLGPRQPRWRRSVIRASIDALATPK